MKSILQWNNGMMFDVSDGTHSIQIDAKAPIGKGMALTPKDLVIAGLGGCTAMDVVALLKKHKQPVEALQVTVDVTPSEGGSPVVFKSAQIDFKATGAVDKNILVEAVRLSQTKYCGVSAMLTKAFPISYRVFVNEELVGEGLAGFGESQ